MSPLCVRSLPGSRTERALNASFYRMLPELRTLLAPLHTIPYLRIDTPHIVCVFSVRYSSAARLLDHIPENVQAVHRGQTAEAQDFSQLAPVQAAAQLPVWPPLEHSEENEDEAEVTEAPGDDIDDDLLGALGL